MKGIEPIRLELSDDDVVQIVRVLDGTLPESHYLMRLFRDEQERRYLVNRYRDTVRDLYRLLSRQAGVKDAELDRVIAALPAKALEALHEWSTAINNKENTR